LVRKEAEERIEEKSRARTVDGVAWRQLLETVKAIPVRRRLDLIFHGNQVVLNSLHKEYTVRNEAAHDYKSLPREAKDVSVWLKELEDLIDKF